MEVHPNPGSVQNSAAASGAKPEEHGNLSDNAATPAADPSSEGPAPASAPPPPPPSAPASMKERYVACMVLQGVGDAMGYCDGDWEFCRSGPQIHRDLMDFTDGVGIKALHLKLPHWIVSDDTVMALATAEGLVQAWGAPFPQQFKAIAARYVDCMNDMMGRAPGGTTICNVRLLGRSGDAWDTVPFDKTSGGCGAAMRAVCIGLAYHKPEQLPELVAVGIETGRMSHHHPTGYLGSVAAALFTALAVQGVPMEKWGAILVGECMDLCRRYIRATGRYVKQNLNNFDYFCASWKAYLELRHIEDGKGPAVFPEVYGVKERDAFYKAVSFRGWGGASGHDCPMIAYDALLGCKGDWEELCLRGVLHGGDNDSTGILTCGWFGALHGFRGVPQLNHQDLEYRSRLDNLGEELYKLAYEGKGAVPKVVIPTTEELDKRDAAERAAIEREQDERDRKAKAEEEREKGKEKEKESKSEEKKVGSSVCSGPTVLLLKN